jgi:Transcriptional regulator
MDALRDLETLVAIVEEGSLTSAARRLGRSLQASAGRCRCSSGAHGSTLIVRTTRTSQPSAAGMRFYERVKGALTELELARTELAEEAHRLTGRLRSMRPRCSDQNSSRRSPRNFCSVIHNWRCRSI